MDQSFLLKLKNVSARVMHQLIVPQGSLPYVFFVFPGELLPELMLQACNPSPYPAKGTCLESGVGRDGVTDIIHHLGWNFGCIVYGVVVEVGIWNVRGPDYACHPAPLVIRAFAP